MQSQQQTVTDIQPALNGEIKTETTTPTMTDEQKDEAIKQYLFMEFTKKYQDISTFVNNLNLNPKIKEITLKSFDDAYLWTQEGFKSLMVRMPEQPKQEVVATMTPTELTDTIVKTAKKAKRRNAKRR